MNKKQDLDVDLVCNVSSQKTKSLNTQEFVAVMRRSRLRVDSLVLLPYFTELSTSYLSCITNTSCKQTLLLLLEEHSTNNTKQ